MLSASYATRAKAQTSCGQSVSAAQGTSNAPAASSPCIHGRNMRPSLSGPGRGARWQACACVVVR